MEELEKNYVDTLSYLRKVMLNYFSVLCLMICFQRVEYGKWETSHFTMELTWQTLPQVDQV